jgi:hypothetical protein
VARGVCWRESWLGLLLYALAQQAGPGHVGETGRGQGEVIASCPCRVGSRRGWSGGAGCWLGVSDGGEGEEREEEDLT